jgi:hypothetical protein
MKDAMSIPALLTRLHACDPACYEDIRRRCIISLKGLLIAWDSMEQTQRENYEDVIQGCCQKSIAAKGWPVILSLDCNPDHPKTWGVEICNGTENGAIGKVEGCGSPAIALLEAYCMACEVQT